MSDNKQTDGNPIEKMHKFINQILESEHVSITDLAALMEVPVKCVYRLRSERERVFRGGRRSALLGGAYIRIWIWIAEWFGLKVEDKAIKLQLSDRLEQQPVYLLGNNLGDPLHMRDGGFWTDMMPENKMPEYAKNWLAAEKVAAEKHTTPATAAESGLPNITGDAAQAYASADGSYTPAEAPETEIAVVDDIHGSDARARVTLHLCGEYLEKIYAEAEREGFSVPEFIIHAVSSYMYRLT